MCVCGGGVNVQPALAVHSSSPVRAPAGSRAGRPDRGREEGGGRIVRSLSPRVAAGAVGAQEGGAGRGGGGGGGESALAVKDKVLDTIVRYQLWSAEGVRQAVEEGLLAHRQISSTILVPALRELATEVGVECEAVFARFEETSLQHARYVSGAQLGAGIYEIVGLFLLYYSRSLFTM